ncbi:MAG: aminotransferase class I/II-fold pyridoxal phosphate-dependent enzyme [Clostridia bacterium]|nr:aminotransferase class I/II-fold pyridoxal phosphate-dependent enzyme [Clostridia bacterium]
MDYGKKINPAVRSIKPSGIRKFFDIAAEIPDAISLGVGEPDFVTPWSTRSAAITSIRRGHTAYTSNRGLKELRTEISRYLSSRFFLDYDPEKEMFVTVGASEAIDLALRTLVSFGDEVLVPDPSYVSYVPGIMLAGGVPVPVPTRAEDDFALTVSALESVATEKSKVLILPYPNNPTGAIMTKEQLEDVARFAKERDLMIISDEIYAELTYGRRHVSVCTLDGMKERCVLISGFSKAFAMTGWRIGYVAASKEVTDEMLKIHQYTIMCAPTFSQYAALDALKSGATDGYADVEYMREQYDMRRSFLASRLSDMGLNCFEPKGAFYVFPSVKKSGMDGEEFAERLLKGKHVAVVPGNAFGEGGKEFVRCSYACSLSTLKTACERIEEFLK